MNGNHKPRRGLGPLETVVRALRRHWVFPVVVPLLALVATFTTLQFLPRVYEASSQLRIDQQRSNLAVLDALKSLATGSHIETEMVVIRSSRTLAEGVVDSLALRATLRSPRGAPRARYFERVTVMRDAPARTWVIRPRAERVEVVAADGPGETYGFGRGETLRFGGVEAVLTRDALDASELRLSIAPRSEAVRHYQRRLSVTRPNREADVVRIAYTSTDSLLVHEVVNTVVRHFIRRRQQEQSTEAVDMVAFLSEQIDTLTLQLTSAEEALRDYSENTGIIAMQAQSESFVTRLADLKAQRDLADAERRALAGLVSPDRDGAASYRNIVGFHTILKSPSASELLRALNEAENVRAAMLQKYTPENPEVAMQTKRIEELEDQLRGIATSYLTGLHNTVASLDAVLSGYEGELRQIPEQEIRLARLRRQATVLEEIHTLLQTRVKEAEIAAAVRDASVKLLDPAIAPGRPIRPRPKLSLAFATLLGLGLGLAGAVVRDHADRTVRTREELQVALPGLPILSVIPRARVARTNGRGRAGVVERESASAEAYRQLRTNLSFARPDRPQQVLVLTSPTPGDGKSMTSVNLAVTLAQQGGRCIVVDADMRRGALHETFGVAGEPGLSQVLANQVPVDQAIRTIRVTGDQVSLDFLAAGIQPPNPAELLASPRFGELIQQCRARYDTVIVDAPPLNLVTDASLMGAVADGVLVVVRAGITRDDALQFAMDQLEAVHAPLVGVVLNDVNPRTQGYYGNYTAYYGGQRRS